MILRRRPNELERLVLTHYYVWLGFTNAGEWWDHRFVPLMNYLTVSGCA